MTINYYVLARELVLTSANNQFIVSEDGGADVTITLTAGSYYLYGDGTESGDLCEEIAAQLNAHASLSNTYTCSYTASIDNSAFALTGSVTITTNGTSINVKGSTYSGTATFDMYWIGFSRNTNSGLTSVSGVVSPSITWCPDQPPTLIDGDRVEGQSIQHRGPSGRRHTFVVDDPVEYRALRFDFTTAERAKNSTSWSPYTSSFQLFWEDIRQGMPIKLFSTTVSSGTDLTTLTTASHLVDDYVLSSPLEEFRPTRDTPVPTWAWDIELAEYFS